MFLIINLQCNNVHNINKISRKKPCKTKPPHPLNYALPSKGHNKLQLLALRNLSVQFLESE